LFVVLAIVLKLSPAGRPGTRPTRDWNRGGLKKKQGRKNLVWLGWPDGLTRPTRGWNWAGLKKKQGKKKPGVTRMTRRVDPAKPGQDPVANPLTFVFLLKRRRFDYKKRTDPTDPVTRSKPGTRALNGAWS